MTREEKIQAIIREQKNAYARAWYHAHKDRHREIQERSIRKKAERILAEREGAANAANEDD